MENSQLPEVLKKMKDSAKSLGEQALHQLELMIQVMKAQFNRTSLVPIPWTATLAIPMALSYFLFPVDLIPDFLPFVGFIDDVFVIGLVFSWLLTFMHLFERSLKYEERIRSLMKENESLLQGRDPHQCVICMDASVGTILHPCNHGCLCVDCVPLVTTCPMCRQKIKKYSKVFFS